jgi:hypothetical protein
MDTHQHQDTGSVPTSAEQIAEAETRDQVATAEAPESSYLTSDQEVIRREREHLRRRQDASGHADDCQVGLAISGGGIRSATFALGVMQALAKS